MDLQSNSNIWFDYSLWMFAISFTLAAIQFFIKSQFYEKLGSANLRELALKRLKEQIEDIKTGGEPDNNYKNLEMDAVAKIINDRNSLFSSSNQLLDVCWYLQIFSAVFFIIGMFVSILLVTSL